VCDADQSQYTEACECMSRGVGESPGVHEGGYDVRWKEWRDDSML